MKMSVNKSNILSSKGWTACQTLRQRTNHKSKSLNPVAFVVCCERCPGLTHGYTFHCAAHEVKSIPVALLACMHRAVFQTGCAVLECILSMHAADMCVFFFSASVFDLVVFTISLLIFPFRTTGLAPNVNVNKWVIFEMRESISHSG